MVRAAYPGAAQGPGASDPVAHGGRGQPADRSLRRAPAAAGNLHDLYGARIGEALWLDWRNVDLARRHVAFPHTKNGDARGVPLHERVVVALANLPHRQGEVFRRPDGLPYERPKRADDTSA